MIVGECRQDPLLGATKHFYGATSHLAAKVRNHSSHQHPRRRRLPQLASGIPEKKRKALTRPFRGPCRGLNGPNQAGSRVGALPGPTRIASRNRSLSGDSPEAGVLPYPVLRLSRDRGLHLGLTRGWGQSRARRKETRGGGRRLNVPAQTQLRDTSQERPGVPTQSASRKQAQNENPRNPPPPPPCSTVANLGTGPAAHQRKSLRHSRL